MADLRHRSREPELMDGEAVSQAEFAACLHDLATVNTVTLARPPTFAFIARALRARPDARLTVLDVGFGAGDMLQALAARAGPRLRLIGIDLNPRSEAVARERTAPHLHIEYRTGDLFAWPEDDPIDIVISSLVTHHMEDAEIVRFLAWMEARARLGWFVNDLHRHWLPYHTFRLVAGAMRWHRFVRHDGPLSIARAFRREELEALLETAGVALVSRLRWRFPFRYCIERAKW
jgi:2-polyprenyl-3-methyl-5-hydroxy-6-metoxy-1,4-benzoquinol methylase